MLTNAEFIIRTLEEENVSYIFGVPGGNIEAFNIALKDSNIEFILCRNEQHAAHMATGYSMTSGNIGVCMTTSGPAALYAISGLTNAVADGIPVILITGQVAESNFGNGAVQAWEPLGHKDMLNISSSVVKNSYRLTDNNTVSIIRRAIFEAKSIPRGVIHIDCPSDIARNSCSSNFVSKLTDTSNYIISEELLNIVVSHITQAQNPLVLAGWGCVQSKAEKELLRFIDKTKIPIVTTCKSKGIISEHHPLSAGNIGLGISDKASWYLNNIESDLLIVIGSSISEFSSNWDKRLQPSGKIIQVDINPSKIGNSIYNIDIPIISDSKSFLSQLNDFIKETVFKSVSKFCDYTPPVHENTDINYKGYNPELLMEDLNNNLPDNTYYCTGAGNCMGYAAKFLKMRTPSLYIPTASANMGWCLPGAIGMKIGMPDTPVVAILGDGDMMMSINELATLAQYKVPLIIIILNNGGFGMVKQGRKIATELFDINIPQKIPHDFQNIKFNELSNIFGIQGITCDGSERINKNMMDGILSLNKPTIINVIVDIHHTAPIEDRIRNIHTKITSQ